ncbi:uncharacterized protein LOC111068662 [Drosophila obscura]|uniref:uncharacterized protein LOC111068662 n=1 Tax=Drosophila obscura TaxID=7282 RepID=UPI001BB29C42|nr:uncharacterized protein LOC111068662 [Drosophila obscura]
MAKTYLRLNNRQTGLRGDASNSAQKFNADPYENILGVRAQVASQHLSQSACPGVEFVGLAIAVPLPVLLHAPALSRASSVQHKYSTPNIYLFWQAPSANHFSISGSGLPAQVQIRAIWAITYPKMPQESTLNGLKASERSKVLGIRPHVIGQSNLICRMDFAPGGHNDPWQQCRSSNRDGRISYK